MPYIDIYVLQIFLNATVIIYNVILITYYTICEYDTASLDSLLIVTATPHNH